MDIDFYFYIVGTAGNFTAERSQTAFCYTTATKDISGEGNPLKRLCSFVFFAFLTLAPLPAASLSAHVDTDSSVPGVWSYTVFNDELWDSNQYIFQVFVLIAAPSTVTGSPEAWVADTDNMSYVVWTNAEIALPYPHDIAPGTSLAGFQISSPNAISLTSIAAAQGWDHLADARGLSSDAILVDAPFATPEPRWAFLAPLLLAVWGYRRRMAAGAAHLW